MLEKLRALLSQHGRISGILIDEADGLPSSTAFRHRFGSLVSAYRLIGYDPQIDYSFIETNRKLRAAAPGNRRVGRSARFRRWAPPPPGTSRPACST